MSNYTKENLIAIPPTAVPAGTLAIKVGNEIFTPGNIRIGYMAFYKCASVDTTAKTWTGYKAVLTDGVYSFEDNVTAGLTYGAAYTPGIDYIYNDGATVQVKRMWDGASVYAGLVFDLPMDEMATSALTGQGLTIAEDVQATEYNGKKCFLFLACPGITFPADDLSTDDYTISISMARTHTDQIQTALGYGQRGSTGATALIGVDNGDELFFGGYGVEVYGDSMEQGKWYHGAVTKLGTQLTLYLNGKSVATHTFTDGLVQGIGYIGRNSGGSENFHGYLADAKIWNRALSADEIMTVYQDANLPE